MTSCSASALQPRSRKSSARVEQRPRAVGGRGARRRRAPYGGRAWRRAARGGQLGRIVQRPERAAALGQHLTVESQRLVGLREPCAPELGETPQQRGARLARGRTGARAGRNLAGRGPRQQLGATFPVADGQQQALGRGPRGRVLGIEIEDREPGVAAQPRHWVRAELLGTAHRDVAQEAQLLRSRRRHARPRRDGEAQRLGGPARAFSRRRRAAPTSGRSAGNSASAMSRTSSAASNSPAASSSEARFGERRPPLKAVVAHEGGPPRRLRAPPPARAQRADLAQQAGPARRAGGNCLRRRAAPAAPCSKHGDGAHRIVEPRERLGLRRSPRTESARGLELGGVRRAASSSRPPSARELVSLDDAREELVSEAQAPRRPPGVPPPRARGRRTARAPSDARPAPSRASRRCACR